MCDSVQNNFAEIWSSKVKESSSCNLKCTYFIFVGQISTSYNPGVCYCYHKDLPYILTTSNILPYKVELQIQNRVDTSNKPPVSSQSTPMLKTGCMFDILPLFKEEHWLYAKFLQDSTKVKGSSLHVLICTSYCVFFVRQYWPNYLVKTDIPISRKIILLKVLSIKCTLKCKLPWQIQGTTGGWCNCGPRQSHAYPW